MKQILKFIGYFILGLIIVIIGFVAYFQFSTSKDIKPISMIPANSLVIFESDNFTESLLDVSQTNYWKSIITSDALKDFQEGLTLFDESLEKHKWLRPIFRNQQLTLSVHQGLNYQPEYLIITDIRKYGKLNLVPKLGALLKWKIKEQTVDSCKLYTVYFPDYEETLHLSTYENLLITSTSYKLLERTIQKRKSVVKENDKRDMVLTAFSKERLNIYTNIKRLQKFILKNNTSSFFDGIGFTALGGDFSNESLTFNGYSGIYDSIPSPFLALKNTSANYRENEKVIPADVLFYLDFNVTDFTHFYNQFVSQYSELDPIGYTTYMGGLKLTQSYLGIDIEKDFFNWLAGEITVSKLKPIPNTREDDILAVVKAKDINLAKEKLEELTTKIKNRTSFKFNKIIYKNHEINYLNIRGFFKLFMGNFLNSREKPYYTIIDDCIVFSNSSDILQYTIDNYLIGNTLERNKDFQAYMENFSARGQVTAYLNMHRLYEHLYLYSKGKDREEIQKYRTIIQNLGLLGFQLLPEGNLFKTKIYSFSLEGSDIDAELYNNINSAENLMIEEFENLDFKIDLGDDYADKNGNIQYHLTHPERVQDSILVHEGLLEDGKLQDMWRSFYSSGNIKSVVTYKDGEVDGTAVFYFDNDKHIIRAEVEYEDNLIDGMYKEYYSNGNIKASLEFKDGKRWGEAKYYYRNGQVKIEGKYRKGKRDSKWIYYSKAGEVIKKENW